MTTNCEDFKTAMTALIYDELEENLAEELRAHAAVCPSCAKAVQQLILTRKLTRLIETPPPSKEMDAAIFAAAKAHCDAVTENAERLSEPSVPEESAAMHRSFIARLRSILISPAFATAAAAGIVLLITVFLKESMPEADRSEKDVKSLMDGHPPIDIIEAPNAPAPDILPGTPPTEEARPSALSTAASADEKQDAVVLDKSSTSGNAEVARTPRRSSNILSEKSKGAGNAYGTIDRLQSASKPKSSRKTSGIGANEGVFSSPPAERKKTTASKAMSDGDADFVAPMPAKEEALKAAPSRSTESRSSSAYLGGSLPDEMDDIAEEREAAAPSPASSPQEARVHQRGKDAFSRGDCTTAIAAFEASIQSGRLLPAEQAEAMFQLGQCEKRQGRCSRALHWFDKVIQSHRNYPKRPHALLEAAQCRRRLGQISEARALLYQLREIPGWAETAKHQLDNL